MLRSFRWCTILRTLRPLALLGALLVASLDAGAQAPSARVERGRYLVESILGCGNCHTPKTPEGEPIAGRNLSGGGVTFSLPPFAGAASNITPDRDTGIGSWSDEDIKRAIVDGKRPNHGRLANTELAVVMPTPFFKALTPSDLDAVVAYLRSVPAIRNEVAPPVYRMAQKHQPFPDAEAGFSDQKMGDPVYRGRYLATIGHCLECHSPQEKGVFDYGRLGAGGRVFNVELVQGFPSSWPGSQSRQHHVASDGRDRRLDRRRDQARDNARHLARRPQAAAADGDLVLREAEPRGPERDRRVPADVEAAGEVMASPGPRSPGPVSRACHARA